jgi:PAS domain S-box-containing protein
MSEQIRHQIHRRNLIFLAALCTLLVLGFWANDSYAIWQIWHDPRLCPNVDCQKEMSKIFWIDIIQIIIYLIVSILAIWFFLRDFDYRSIHIDKQSATQQEVQDLYDNAPCGYHSLDANGVFIHINQTELNWLGYSKEEVIGKMRLADLQESFSKEQFLEDFKNNLRGEGVRNLEMNLRRKDGSLLPVLINGTMIRDEKGGFRHTRTTLTDFSEQRKLLNELEKAREIAEKSVETKERFMANMSHEIRTPMNALIGFTNLLERTELNERQEEFVKTIKSAGGNLMTLINDLLDFSKIEAGMLRIEATTFDLNSLVQSLETLFKPKAQEKKVDFDVQVSRRIPENVIGDPTRVSQIVVNLLSNAFKFTERGYVALTTELFDDNTDFATVKITVKDTGIGIENQELPRIFQRFQQAQDDTTRLYGGSGLGLAIVKNLVEAMGGFVEADSKIGFGSTFSVILPFKKAPNLEFQISNFKFQTDNIPPQYLSDLNANSKNSDVQTSNFKRQTNSSDVQTSNVKHQTQRILVVEDNPMNQRLAALLLSDWGYEYDIVEDGQQAVDLVQKIDFQLILMDIQLPIMDGYEATTMIRNTLKNPIPIIATTAHAFAGEREKCIAAGMNDYIPKPLQEDAVLAIIQKYIKK